jgi:hypothetical protein
MKFLVTWKWKGKDGAEINKRFAKWKPVEGTKFLFPMHTVLGANKAFTITEGTDIETMVKNITPWTDICTFKISPIVESRELVPQE